MEPAVVIVLLAAGMARRMGSSRNHKLLAQFDGVPMVRRSAQRAVESDAVSVVVVVGHRQADIRAALTNLPVTIVENPHYASGMASSLATGIAAAGGAGVLVMLSDMPEITTDHLNSLIVAFCRADGRSIVRAISHGKPGNPVILPQSLHKDIGQLKGDVGARDLILSSGLQVIDVEIGMAAELDVDTPEAIKAAGGYPETD